jgi:hypothetical protein
MKAEKIQLYEVIEILENLEEAKIKFETEQKLNLLPAKRLSEISPQDLEPIEETGIELKDPATYLIYLIKIEEISYSPYENSPYWLEDSIAISTYEQFKLYILRLNPWDLFNKKTKKLTYLCLFVKDYLEKELNGAGKNHLVDLLRQLEIDLRTHQEEFWLNIRDCLTANPSPTVDEMVAEKLEGVKDFIDNSYKGKKDYCVDWQAFQAEKDAIIKNLEVRLTEGSYKHLNNPSLFLSTTNSNNNNFNNTVGNSNNISNNVIQDKKTGKDWTLPQETAENGETFEMPIKSEVAENINEWGGQRAHLTKDQKNNLIQVGAKVNELDHFNQQNNDNSTSSDNNQTSTGNNNSFTSQEAFNVALLNWMDEVVEKYINYEAILAKLDRHFKQVFLFGC